MKPKILTLLIISGLSLLVACKSSTPPYEGYLFAYFEGSETIDRESQEQLRFAVSEDAVNWKALNENRPIIPSGDISKSGGIRDPHILRGENDGEFYLVATDMSTAKNGWGPNPGLVMMKYNDLINWDHDWIDLANEYEVWRCGCAHF